MAAPRTLHALLAAAALLLAPGCPVYNQECSPILNDPDVITGWLGGDVQTIKAVARTRDNPFGQLVAEAYYHAFDSGTTAHLPDLGLENAGSIRSEGVCVSRETVKKGPVRRSVLREVLPFDNSIINISVTHKQLKNILEHSISSLTPAGTTSPPGGFLQLWGATVEADCNRTAEALKSDGTRDHEGDRITAITLLKRDGTSVPLPFPPSDTEKVRIALNNFIGQGGDNFLDLKSTDVNAPDTISAGGFDFEIIASYFKATYTEAKPLPATPPARWILTDCR
jgi:5'-nucleotidase / UDP-sugar diphosphatase